MIERLQRSIPQEENEMTTHATTTTPRSTAKRASKRPSNSEVSEDKVRTRAHEIYLARGEGPGNALSDWLEAEHELNGSTDNA